MVAKLLIKIGSDNYLFSRKIAPGKNKHNKLEMVGGHINKNETPLMGLIREAREEELTGRLSELLEKQEPQFSKIEVQGKKHFETHYLFLLEITIEDAQALIPDKKESSAFVFISAKDFDNDDNLKMISDQFTPMTLEILKAMGRKI